MRPPVEPGTSNTRCGRSDRGRRPAALIADLDAVVAPGITEVQHPMYFGWFPSNASCHRSLATPPVGPGIARHLLGVITEPDRGRRGRDRMAAPTHGAQPQWSGVIQDTASTGCSRRVAGSE